MTLKALIRVLFYLENMMNINELENLSCLKLKEEDKENLRKDLNNVLKMMHEIDALSLNENILKENQESEFIKAQSEFIEKDSVGLNIYENKFLAPKVIKK